MSAEDEYVKEIELDGEKYTVTVVDTAGQVGSIRSACRNSCL